MKIISWNIDIRPFSDKGCLPQTERIDKIITTICEQEADVIVLQETNNDFANKLKNKLGDNYLVFIHKEFRNSNVKVLMAYKIINENINIKQYDKTNGRDFAYTRWIELSYGGMEILGLHASLPESKEDTVRRKQKAFWKRILEYAYVKKNENVLLIGDFNVYEKTEFCNFPSRAFEDFKKLQNMGWKVLKTKMINDLSYCNFGQWDRQLDYVLVSPNFENKPKLSMDPFEKLSDHKMLSVHIDI